jgi:hypothetical protein
VPLALIALSLAAGLFLGMLVCSEIGRRIGAARLAREPERRGRDGGAAEAGVFGLLGLLIAFTFSGAASRFEDRRQLIAEEANAIGTAYLRVDLLPGDAQPAIRDLFRQYTSLRATVYRNTGDLEAVVARLADGAVLQQEIWATASAASRLTEAPPQAMMLLLPAVNEMIDITTTRATATETHPPLVIFSLLGGLCLIGALLVGHGTAPGKGRSWFHPVIFAAILSLTVYVIVDLEYPRLGLIRIDAADQALLDLRNSMQ